MLNVLLQGGPRGRSGACKQWDRVTNRNTATTRSGAQTKREACKISRFQDLFPTEDSNYK